MNKKFKRPGRPTRGPLERQRTMLWAHAVCMVAGRSAMALEALLGSDGQWEGVWARYSRGQVSPSSARVLRISMILPGTERYFFCPLWTLVENREFSRSELRTSVQWLPKIFRDALIGEGESANGSFWRADYAAIDLLVEAERLVKDQKFGLDAVTVIIILLREAELLQNGRLYLRAMKSWASIENSRDAQLVLRKLSNKVLDKVAEPLRNLRFSQPDIDVIWRTHVEWYCEKRNASRRSFELIDALNELPISRLA